MFRSSVEEIYFRGSLDEVVGYFADLEEPRSTVNRKHPLVSVVVIAVRAVLAGAGGPTAIAKWAACKEEFLKNLLPLPNGIPRKEVFRRVLAALQPSAFQACFVPWLQSLPARAAAATGVSQPLLAVDGKTLRRSHDGGKGLGALPAVSVWAWGIENSCPWSLDVTYRADESRLREQALRENFAWLDRMTLSLLKQHAGKDSTAMKRRSCGWNDDFLLEVLTGIKP